MAQLGTASNDDITASQSEVYGLEGSDIIAAYTTDFFELYGGSGKDMVRFYDTSYGYMYGGSGDDTLSGGLLGDILLGEIGADLLVGGEIDDQLFNNNGQLAIYLNRSTGDDILDGGVHRDALYGFDGNDSLYGGADDDSGSIFAIDVYRTSHEVAAGLFGGAGNDSLDGDEGNDTLNGGTGADRMVGGEGDDFLYVDNGADQVIEAVGTGADRVLASVNYTVSAGQSIELLTTTSAAGTAAITLTGNELAQTLIGNAGANLLNGGGGPDTLQGLSGNDTYVVDLATDRVLEAAGGGTSDRINASASYTIFAGQQIEILGTTSAAGTVAINLTGNALNQTIYGNAGANVLDGVGATDTLSGFGGADIFAFTTPLVAGNIDRITDFSSAADTIRLDRTVFDALGLGTLPASAYKDIGDPGATVDASDRILYDDDSGALYYDINGSGDGARLQFATLVNRPVTLTNADFVVVA